MQKRISNPRIKSEINGLAVHDHHLDKQALTIVAAVVPFKWKGKDCSLNYCRIAGSQPDLRLQSRRDHRALTPPRRDAELRHQVSALEKELRRAAKGASRSSAASDSDTEAAAGTKRRSSATRLAAHCAKLGLSAVSYRQLVGVSGLTIYRWEQGKARPRAAQLESLAAVRDLGAREVAELASHAMARQMWEARDDRFPFTGSRFCFVRIYRRCLKDFQRPVGVSYQSRPLPWRRLHSVWGLDCFWRR